MIITSAAELANIPHIEPKTVKYCSRQSWLVLCVCSKLAIVWIIIYYIAYRSERHFPYIKTGSDIIYIAKAKYIETHQLFRSDQPIKVLALGNSKVLAGFIPAQFDCEVSGATSFNAGFPNANYFLPQLNAMLRRGNVPTHVLYMVGWVDQPVEPKSIFHYLPPDREIMNYLFPFRMSLRDAALFFLRSRSFGGPVASYHHAENEVAKMERARGYYFIEGQSRFPDHRLPSNFHLTGDDASLIDYRQPAPSSASFSKLKALADHYRFKIVVLPYYLREGERGHPGANQSMAATFHSNPEFRVIGDEYFLFENRYFSDTAHLNPDGAKMYTSLIAKLMNAELASERR